ncbi:PTS sugar transporter subunit IIA, partial [Mycoplasmopsis synoviae]
GNGFSLVTWKERVGFRKKVKVSVLVCVAPIDGETHTKIAIPQLVAIFESPENIAKIASFQTKEQVIDFISKIDSTKYLYKEKMNKPLLQIALDFWEIQDAILAVKKAKKYI